MAWSGPPARPEAQPEHPNHEVRHPEVGGADRDVHGRIAERHISGIHDRRGAAHEDEQVEVEQPQRAARIEEGQQEDDPERKPDELHTHAWLAPRAHPGDAGREEVEEEPKGAPEVGQNQARSPPPGQTRPVAHERRGWNELPGGERELGGIVEYVVGAQPGPGIFCLAEHTDPRQRHYLNLYKLGEGPLYSFYTPYHLCHFEVPITVARAALFGDAAIAPLGPPLVEVVAAAKVDLEAGQEIDSLGGYLTYGLAENADVATGEQLLPMGLAEGCRLRRDVAKDEVLTYDDVEIPGGRLIDKLRREQAARFS